MKYKIEYLVNNKSKLVENLVNLELNHNFEFDKSSYQHWRKLAEKCEKVGDITMFANGYREGLDDTLEYDDEAKKNWDGLFDVASPQEVANAMNKRVRDKDKVFNPKKNESLKEAHLGPYKYRYETHWINGRDVLLGASKTKDGAENIAYNQIEDILGNPWENDRNKYKIIDSLYIYDSENDDDVMSVELEDYIDSILSELGSRIKLKKESLKERYADDAVVLTAPLRKKLNNICQKYSGFHLPQEIAPMWEELYNLGIEVLIMGPPHDTAPGAKSWTVPFTLNGETVGNSRFVYSVYEGSEGLKNDYNMYFS